MGYQKDMKKKETKIEYKHEHKKIDLQGKDSNEKDSTNFTKRKLQDYIIKKITKKSLKKTSSLKIMNVAGYSNEDNPFGDSNLSQPFVWKKKIEAHVRKEGLTKSLKQLEEKRPKDRQIDEQIKQIKERKEQKAIKDVRREMDKELFGRNKASFEYQDWQKREDKFEFEQSKLRSKLRLLNDQAKPMDILPKNLHNGDNMIVDLDVDLMNFDDFDGIENKVSHKQQQKLQERNPIKEECELRKPKYFNEVRTGYTWNKYNQMYYTHDNPPPKNVQGYKFKILYPNLLDKSKIPTYTLNKEQDGSNNGEKCFLFFHAGPPYKDIVFQIVNNEWEYSYKKGFKCTFENEVFHLEFYFKKFKYRR